MSDVNILRIDEKIRTRLNNTDDEIFYINETVSLLDEYRHIKKMNKQVINFLKSKDNLKKENKRLSEIIKQYLDIAKNYTEELCILDHNSNDTHLLTSCSKCGSEYVDDGAEYVNVCTNCGAHTELLGETYTYRDNNRLNKTFNYKYDRKSHFRETVSQYQGKQNITVKKKVYEDIEKQLKIYNLINEEGKTRKEKYAKVTKQHIRLFLKETNHCKHYEDYIFIYHKITDKPVPDITHVENAIFKDHKLMLETYSNLSDDEIEERKNFLNAKFILLQLLRKHKVKVDIEDFDILKSCERFNYHTRVCKLIFDKLGWDKSTVT